MRTLFGFRKKKLVTVIMSKIKNYGDYEYFIENPNNAEKQIEQWQNDDKKDRGKKGLEKLLACLKR